MFAFTRSLKPNTLSEPTPHPCDIISLPEEKQAESCFITTLERCSTANINFIYIVLLTREPNPDDAYISFGSALGLYHATFSQQLGTKASLQRWTDLRSLHLLNNQVGDGFITIIDSFK